MEYNSDRYYINFKGDKALRSFIIFKSFTWCSSRSPLWFIRVFRLLIMSTMIWFTKHVAKERVEGSWIRTRNEQARRWTKQIANIRCASQTIGVKSCVMWWNWRTHHVAPISEATGGRSMLLTYFFVAEGNSLIGQVQGSCFIHSFISLYAPIISQTFRNGSRCRDISPTENVGWNKIRHAHLYVPRALWLKKSLRSNRERSLLHEEMNRRSEVPSMSWTCEITSGIGKLRIWRQFPHYPQIHTRARQGSQAIHTFTQTTQAVPIPCTHVLHTSYYKNYCSYSRHWDLQ